MSNIILCVVVNVTIKTLYYDTMPAVSFRRARHGPSSTVQNVFLISDMFLAHTKCFPPHDRTAGARDRMRIKRFVDIKQN